MVQGAVTQVQNQTGAGRNKLPQAIRIWHLTDVFEMLSFWERVAERAFTLHGHPPGSSLFWASIATSTIWLHHKRLKTACLKSGAVEFV